MIGRCTPLLLAALLLAGCASFTPDGGMGPVVERADAELGRDVVKIDSAEKAAVAADRVRGLLARPLGLEQAVQVALLNNRGLQADYNALGLAEADYVAATLPEAPGLVFERVSAAHLLDIERRLVVDLLSIATLPTRAEAGAHRFEAARFRAIEATFRTAAEARRAWIRAVAAAETVAFLEQARLSADAAADLTRKLGETGAATKLDQARASAFYAEISNDLARARLRAATEREALVRQLGLWGADLAFKLPGRLPSLPAKLEGASELEARAIAYRVDLLADRKDLQARAREIGLGEATRFVAQLELAGISATEWEDGAKSSRRGFEAELRIPIFDLGETGVRRAREGYMQAVNRLTEKAVNARSEVRAGYATYRATWAIARQYQNRILPLRRIVSEQAVLEYNGMLKDVFTLLTTARESAASNMAAIEAKRDFHLAAVDFRAALVGGGGSSGPVASRQHRPGRGRRRRPLKEDHVMTVTRRKLLGAGGAAAALIGASAVSGRAQAAAIPEAPTMKEAVMQPPLVPTSGPDYQPVVTLNGWTLPWRLNGDWKEFHLVAEPVTREIAAGMVAHLWGYNGQSPGSDHRGGRGRQGPHLRHQQAARAHHRALARPAPALRHGRGRRPDPAAYPARQDLRLRVPADEERNLHVPPARRRDGADGDGHDGLLRRPSADPAFMPVDRDFVFLLNAFDIEPGSYVPKVNTMLDFNLWTWNSRAFPGIDPLVCAKGDRVRVRFGNLTMTNHPIHMHGYDFKVTGTDGGWVEAGGALAGGDGRCRRRPDARLRVRRRLAGRLGDPLPQVAPHHERHGARRQHLDRGRQARGGQEDPPPGARLHAHGVDRHGRDGRDGDAAARQHAADDDRLRAVRPGRDGRHVLGREGARGARRRRLQGSRLVRASARHGRLRMEGRGEAGRQRRPGEDRARPDHRGDGREARQGPAAAGHKH